MSNSSSEKPRSRGGNPAAVKGGPPINRWGPSYHRLRRRAIARDLLQRLAMALGADGLVATTEDLPPARVRTDDRQWLDTTVALALGQVELLALQLGDAATGTGRLRPACEACARPWDYGEPDPRPDPIDATLIDTTPDP